MKASHALGRPIIFALLAIMAAFSTFSSSQPLKYQEGKHYQVITSPVKTKNADTIEVMEVFWYGCPHCNLFQVDFSKWSKKQSSDVSIDHTPAMWSKPMVTHAHIYYTVKALRLQKKMHTEIFAAMHSEKKRLLSEQQIFSLFEKHGIDKETFAKTYHSFGVKSQVQQANARARSYGITGTPEVIVNGKYRVSSRTAGSQAEMLNVIDYLVAKERAINKS